MGRRITVTAIRCHMPSPTGFGVRRNRTSLSIRVPIIASTAGRNTSDAVAASATTEIPAYANDRRNDSGNTSNAAREMTTVSALNSTVRPAVSTLRTSAASASLPRRSSSRNRDTTNKL